MLGHTSLESTQVDTRVSIRKLKEIHEATHPARAERTGAGLPDNDPPCAPIKDQ
jgi:integrase/recombinase XerD